MTRDLDSIEQIILNLEKAALQKWGSGDPSGFLEITDDEVRYFDPFINRRIDGWDNLSQYYESLRGKIKIDSFDIINPHFVISDQITILSYNYKSYGGNDIFPWNATEIYRKNMDGHWKIIHTHWSKTAC